MHDRICYLRRGRGDRDARGHARTQTVTCMGTQACTPLGQPPRDTYTRANAHAYTPLTRHTRVHACMQACSSSTCRSTHMHRGMRATCPCRCIYLYWQEVPLLSWQRRLCSPVRRVQQSPSARASPSSVISSRVVGRVLPPVESGTSAPPLHPMLAQAAPAAQSPILQADAACLCPHLAPGRQGHCPGCPPCRGSRRSGGPSPARSGSARGCCTPEWVTPSLNFWQGPHLQHPPPQPCTHPVPVALALALLVTQHRDVLALALEAHLPRGQGISTR